MWSISGLGIYDLRPSNLTIYGQLKDEELREASATMVGTKFLPECFGENEYTTIDWCWKDIS